MPDRRAAVIAREVKPRLGDKLSGAICRKLQDAREEGARRSIRTDAIRSESDDAAARMLVILAPLAQQ